MKQLFQALRFYATLSLTLLLPFLVGAQNHYVKHNATGANDGSSWTNAYTQVQQALDAAVDGETIRVAAGTYLPTFRHQGDSLRHSTFFINKDVAIYGGFSGEPGTEGTFDGRDPATLVTSLSGDLGIADDTSDNAFHVVFIDRVSGSMRLDGFIIEDGNGVGGTPLEGTGTGIFNNADADHSNPTIANCIVRNNYAIESGGGMINYANNGGQSSPLLINTTFRFNSASGGGAMTCLTDNGGNVSPMMIGCKFQGNTARTASGSALSIIAHDALAVPQVINTIITGNHGSEAINAFSTGTGTVDARIINSTITGNAVGSVRVVDLGTPSSTIFIRNSILWNNPSGGGISSNGATEDAAFSDIPFGFPGEGNVGLDPMFVDAPFAVNTPHALGDVHLAAGSPAIDAGRNSDVPAGITTDAEGSARFINSSNGQAGIVDMGAYEVQGGTTSIDDILADTDWKIFPNPVVEKIIVTWSTPSANAELHVIDAYGKLVSSSQMKDGETSIELNVSTLPAGSYFIHLMIDGRQDVKKVVVQ